MIIDILVPSPGESVTQVQLASWLVNDGDIVSRDQEIAEIDSDKATLSISAPEDGKINILAAQGDLLKVGEVLARLDTSFQTVKQDKSTTAAVPPAPIVEPEPPKTVVDSPAGSKELSMTPLARKVFEENHTSEENLKAFISGKRIRKKNAEELVQQMLETPVKSMSRELDRKKMTPLRLKLSERLVAVKNQTAMLTTFNEINMSALIELRKIYADEFQKKYQHKLGYMGFFTKAASIALQAYPMVNSMIEADKILVPGFCDIAIAVSAPKGLVVPVVRNAESLNLPEIELQIASLAAKARDNKLSLEEMSGGTFTITNGGVFGSLMSTPIINPPQSAILGMHAIQDRAVVVNGKIEIQPMMYVALSYDHRIIDGKDSVSFLVMIKELIENPLRMLSNGHDPRKLLLNL